MKLRFLGSYLAGLLAFSTCFSMASAVTLEYAGSHANLVPLFPGGGPANVQNYVVVPWRSEILVKPLDPDGNNAYGTEGYALFATTFTYPDANLYCCDAFIDPVAGDPLFPNLIDLPDWVSASQILAERMAGGYGYALIDDPVLTHGYRDYNWGDTQSPPSNPPHGQAPYVKMGFLDGYDILGNNPLEEPAGRWGFTVGADVPAAFRVGVMTGGGDNGNFAPSQVFIQQVAGVTPVGTPLGTGTLTGSYKDPFVDMHFFDIVGAQEGDQFVFGVTAGEGSFGNSGVAGFSFDLIPNVPEGADFDGDGDVDGRDFLAWQRGASPTPFSSADVALWQAEYNGGALVGGVSVPEPSTVAILLASLLCLKVRRF